MPDHWQELSAFAPDLRVDSVDYDYQYGIALAQLDLWSEARWALLKGARLAPRDKRFLIELAGVAFKEKKPTEAIAYLHRALHLDPCDAYANDFLATLYFLQGNLEAALKYWNVVHKPKVAQVRVEPALRIKPGLLDHAFAFAPESALSLDEWLATQARLRQLEIFASDRFDLVAQADGKFDASFHAEELNGFGSTKLEVAARLLRGLPFQEIDAEYSNLHRAAINLSARYRWDAEKRRAGINLSAPLAGDPRWRARMHAGARDENWDVVSSFAGTVPLAAALNLRREEVSAEITRLMDARWSWSLGTEVSHRDFRNVFAGNVLTPQLLARGLQLKQSAKAVFVLLRLPERRLIVATSSSFEAARLWSRPAQSFARLQGTIETHWLPRMRGDDLETTWRIRSGKTFGQIPFDELLTLGLERDNDLWLRAHIGTRDGRKGSAPLGRDYFLSNWEVDKNIYSNGLIGVKLGPFVDTGAMRDPSAALGSQKWFCDIGAQVKLRVLGVGVAFSYGKDLRTGHNAFYTAQAR